MCTLDSCTVFLFPKNESHERNGYVKFQGILQLQRIESRVSKISMGTTLYVLGYPELRQIIGKSMIVSIIIMYYYIYDIILDRRMDGRLDRLTDIHIGRQRDR